LGCLGHLQIKKELFSVEIKLIKMTYIPEPGIELAVAQGTHVGL
jgi:hypothetical protein